jgi:hypothetical protein
MQASSSVAVLWVQLSYNISVMQGRRPHSTLDDSDEFLQGHRLSGNLRKHQPTEYSLVTKNQTYGIAMLNTYIGKLL